MDEALLLLRLAFGLLFIGHGSQKLFGWFSGAGLRGTATFLESVGFRPARFWALLAGASEFGGGLLLALGFLSPLGSWGIIASMLIAIAKVHWPRFWITDNGIEVPLANIVVAFSVALAGPGDYSLDEILGTELPAGLAIVLLAVTILGCITSLVVSRSRLKSEDPSRGKVA